jgi:hypothetical protein
MIDCCLHLLDVMNIVTVQQHKWSMHTKPTAMDGCINVYRREIFMHFQEVQVFVFQFYDKYIGCCVGVVFVVSFEQISQKLEFIYCNKNVK